MIEKVEVRQLVQGIPIAITVLVGSPMSWSDDQQIVVVTQLGTYIFELNLSPEDGAPGVMFSRSFIPPPLQPNPYNDTEIIVKNIVEHMDRSAAHSLMLDGLVTPGERAWNELDPKIFRNTSPAMPGGDPSHRGYCKGIWSPCCAGTNGRCLLTLVTYDHRVMIMGRDGHEWVSLVDISAIWHKKVSASSWKLVPLPRGAALHEIHSARMHMLGISDIQWTPIFCNGDDKFCILIMVTISGHAVFWKVPVKLTSTTEILILSIEETKLKMTSTIHWFTDKEKSGYLLLGSSNGQVKIFYVDFTEEFLLRDLGYAYADDDSIRVNHIRLLYLEDRHYLLLLCKESFFLVFVVDLTEDKITTHSSANAHLGRLPISGIVCLQKRNIYLSLKDGNIQHIYIRFDGEKVQIEQLDFTFKSEGVSYTGFVSSPHGTLWAILESVSVAYDHLAVREPSQISIYQVGSGEKILKYLNENQLTVYNHVDLLESLRLYVCKMGEPPIQLINLGNVGSHPSSQVKLHYWLSKMCRSLRISDHNNPDSQGGTEAALERYIIVEWITATVKRFTCVDWKSLPQPLHLSLSMMCWWIIDNEKNKEKTTAMALSKKLLVKDKEQCPICTATVPFSQLTSGICENGHTLPRCCRTLLMTKPVIMCPRCKVFVHELAAKLQTEEVATCLYCDGNVVPLSKRQT